MSVLEQITQMKNQGVPDDDIVKQLQEQGISPKAINDALNQAEIKKAVSNENPEERNQEFEGLPAPSQQQGQKLYSPKTQEVSEQGLYSPQEQPQQGESYQGYPNEEVYEYPQTGIDTDTIIEISEQVFFEKIQKMQKKVDETSEFKTLAESKIDSLSERMKKIETIIDKMQIAILEKIGSYGGNLESIKKEMSMMQNSFGKIVNSVSENTKAQKKQKPSAASSERERPSVVVRKRGKVKQNDIFSKLKKISKKK